MARRDYIHGFDPREQARLCDQARYLEPMVFSGVDFPRRARVIEIGCGVGAQTEILLGRFPTVRVEAVDREARQVERARARLREATVSGRAAFSVADATRLPFPDSSFDGAFVCWVLEHVPRPVAVLRELRRVLKPGGIVHGIEVMNSSLVLRPQSPALERYWDAFNVRQRALGGDPDVGPKLGNHLHAAGFARVTTAPYGRHYDQRDRAAYREMIDYWETLLASGAPSLGLRASATAKIAAEFRRVRRAPDGLFYYSPIKFRAEAPRRRRRGGA